MSDNIGNKRRRSPGKPDALKGACPVWGEVWRVNTGKGRAPLYLLHSKGAPVYVSGRLQTRSFEGSDGQTRYMTELVGRELILLPRGNGGHPAPEEELEEEVETEEVMLEELPL